MRSRAILRSAVWGISARPARTLSMALALAAAVACIVFTSSILSGFSREIERLAFGDYPRTLVVRQNALVPSRAGPPSLDDRAWLVSELPGVEASAAWVEGQASVRNMRETRLFSVYGVTGDYRRELDAELMAGRWLGDLETAGLGRVCLVGLGLAEFLGTDDLLDSDISLNGMRCRVIGIYDYARSRPAGRFNDAAIAPFLTVRRYFVLDQGRDDVGPRDADWLSLFMESGSDMDDVRYRADRLLRRTAGVPLSRASPYVYDDPQAAVRDQVQQRNALARLLWTVTLAALATSLLGYGGIAFAATAARRREVALRLAMGAAPNAILSQIALEHVLVGLLAALLGLAAGVAASTLASSAWGWPMSLSVAGMVGAGVLGVVVGLVLGLEAARRSASTSPALAARG